MEGKAPTRIGELLIHLGLLTEGDLMEASHVAVDLGLPLGRALVMSDYISDAQLRAIIQAQSMLKDNVVDMQTVANAMKIIGETECSLDEALAKSGYSPNAEATTNKLGDLLVEAGVLSAEELQVTLQRAQENGLPLGRALGYTGRVAPALLHASLNAQVLLRDGRITRAQAINALRAAHQKQTSFEQELAEQGSYSPPSGARVRIGELFVLAGIVSEENVLVALEHCLLNQKMMGEVLLEMNIVSPELLQAALKLQEAIDTRLLTALTAAEALRRVQARNISIDRAMAEMGLLRSPPAERIRIGEFLLMANMISQDQLQEAVKLASMNNALIGKILVFMGALGKNNLHNALRCQFLMREGFLNEEQAISLVQYCQQKQIPVEEAVGDNAPRVDLSSARSKTSGAQTP
jgi:hypothetical protein